jgi:hypothetical protein
MHIPKCAGTTFRSILIQCFGEEKILFDYADQMTHRGKVVTTIPPGIEVIHGHFAMDKYDELFPDAALITWLRDPIEKTISHYYYWLRNPNNENIPLHQKIIDNKISLEEFGQQPISIDLFTNEFAGKKITDFAFIGITEHFEDSVKLFMNIFNIKKEIRYQSDNINPNKKITDNYPDGRYKKNMSDFNQKDIELYNLAKEELQKKISKLM